MHLHQLDLACMQPIHQGYTTWLYIMLPVHYVLYVACSSELYHMAELYMGGYNAACSSRLYHMGGYNVACSSGL